MTRVVMKKQESSEVVNRTAVFFRCYDVPIEDETLFKGSDRGDYHGNFVPAWNGDSGGTCRLDAAERVRLKAQQLSVGQSKGSTRSLSMGPERTARRAVVD